MLSKKSQYAFKALMYLAQNNDKGPVLIAEIARKKKIPLKFLENILLELKKAGVLESKKGKGGGYYFALPPSQVPMAKIMRLLDGPIALLPCVSLNFYEPCAGCDEHSCGLKRVMAEARDSLLAILEKKNLTDIVDLQEITNC